MKRLPFVKMHGAGNDYIYMRCLGDEGSVELKEEEISDVARKVSDRHFGIGSDGLILILPSDKADFRMRIFNADGSEAKMCGNGARCVGAYLFEHGFVGEGLLTLQTESGERSLKISVGQDGQPVVEVDMGRAELRHSLIPVSPDSRSSLRFPDQEVLYLLTGLESDAIREESGMIDKKFEDKKFIIIPVSMGNPHGVIFVEKLSDDYTCLYGRGLETHPIWPDRANIEFVETISPVRLRMRVWERGSGETLACGTGACASVVAAILTGKCDPSQSVKVEVIGGELTIRLDPATHHILMTGPTATVAEGVFYCQ